MYFQSFETDLSWGSSQASQSSLSPPFGGGNGLGFFSQLLSNLNDYDSVSMIQTLSLNKNSHVCQQISDPYLETPSHLDAKFLQIILPPIL